MMKNWLSVSPMLFFILLFLLLGLISGDFTKIPLVVVFLLSSIFALLTFRNTSIEERIACFSKGAGSLNLLLMIWIFVLAGAFAQVTKDLEAIDVAVNVTMSMFPTEWLIPCLFLSSCMISLSIGTSVGTIVALVPVASGIASKLGIDPAIIVASVVGGAFFGDNLSFISDTTVAATRTQECKSMKDKFKVNIQVALPAALLTFLLYTLIGVNSIEEISWNLQDLWKIIPYLFVLIVAILGMNVLLVLVAGIILTGLLSLSFSSISLNSFLASITDGVLSMSELIIISMLAGGLLEIVRRNGGIDFLVKKVSAHVTGRRGAEYCIALLVSVTNLCTANNTIAILTVGDLVKQISAKYQVDRRVGASILDIFSCVVQSLIPYGAQLLMAYGLSGISPMRIIPYLYYPMILGIVTICAIAFRFPRKYYR